MCRNKLFSILLMFFAFMVNVNAADQNVLGDIKEQREITRGQLKILFSENLKLTPKEADGFWPVYESYRDNLKVINDKELALITEYADAYNGDGLSDKQAIRLVDEFLDAEKDRAKIKIKYLKKFKRVIPNKKVAIFYQVDNRIDAIIKINNAAQIPLLTSN